MNGEKLYSETAKIYSISSLTEQIKKILEDHFDFIWVEAEISNFKAPSSGHYYFVLKDESAQIRSIMFRPKTRRLQFTPEDGMKVIVQGRIGVYQPRGEYQIIVDYLEPLGVGALALAFEQLKKKLAEQGVFDQAVKRTLPYLPQKIAVITSPTGAAIRDFLNVIHRRFANIHIILIPVKVQGSDAASEIITAVTTANQELDVDVIVITRGGGSIEDLWAFNNEELAWAIRKSTIPVVSAIGHEIDITISDLAADLRAPTPSAAAEILITEKEMIEERIEGFRIRLQALSNTLIDMLKQRLRLLSQRFRDPRRYLEDCWMRIDEIQGYLLRTMDLVLRERRSMLQSEMRAIMVHSPVKSISSLSQRLLFQRQTLLHSIQGLLHRQRTNFSIFREKLKGMDPYTILKRGYSITRTLPGKTIVRSITGLNLEGNVNIVIADGELDCSIKKIRLIAD